MAGGRGRVRGKMQGEELGGSPEIQELCVCGAGVARAGAPALNVKEGSWGCGEGQGPAQPDGENLSTWALLCQSEPLKME